MNSDMSNRIKDFSLPNRNWASDRAISVFPTPVGPRNKNEPAGRWGDFKPARDRRMARASALMAWSWLTIRRCSSSSILESLCISSSLIELTGTPVQRETTSSISALVTTPMLLVLVMLGLFEVLARDRAFHPRDDELDAALDVGHFRRQRCLAKLDTRAGFIEKVDGFIG